MTWLSFGLGVAVGAVGVVVGLLGWVAAELHRLDQVLGEANE